MGNSIRTRRFRFLSGASSRITGKKFTTMARRILRRCWRS